MKWLKFLKDVPTKGYKTSQIERLDDAVADVYVDSGIAESTTEPASAAKAAGELGDRIIKSVDERIAEGVNAAADQIFDLVEKKIGLKSTKGGRRPVITTHDNELEDPTDGFKHGFEFYGAVRKSCIGQGTDDRLVRRLKAAGASENINADGGYAVPVEYATNIFNDIVKQDSLMNSCFTIPMGSNSMKLPALNYTQQGSFGVTANWEGEAQTIPTSKPAFRQPQLTLNKLTVLTPVTSELLEDGIAIENVINFLAGEAITYKVNDAIVNGTGAGMPVGVAIHASTVVVTRNTTVSVKAIDVITMDSAFTGDEDRAEWLISKRDVNPQLLTIADAGGRYLYFAPGTFGERKGPALMLGKRVRPLINCKNVGTQGDIILWDPKGYLFGYKSTGINKAMSIHLYFNTDQVAYRWTFRADGRPWRDTTLESAQGSLTYGTAAVLSTL